MKILKKLEKNQRDTIFEEIDKVIDNYDEYFNDVFLVAKFCEETLGICVEDDIICSYCNDLVHIMDQKPDMLILYLDTIKLIEHIGNVDEIYKDQDVLSLLKDYISMFEDLHLDPDLATFIEDKILLGKMVEYGDNVMKFAEVKSHLRDLKDYKDKIKITFYPESQGIPKKYFPLNGDEETPYVAVKLHLQDKPWLVFAFLALSICPFVRLFGHKDLKSSFGGQKNSCNLI
jgi:hypothetical protein